MATFEKITTFTATSAATSFTISSIPATYTDLYLSIRNIGSASTDWHMQFNGDTGANYGYTYAYSEGPDAYAGMYGNSLANVDIYIGEIGTGSGMRMTNIFNYANTNVIKTISNLSAYSDARHGAQIGSWNNTAAITSIKVFHSATSFAAGTTATLYGILGA